MNLAKRYGNQRLGGGLSRRRPSKGAISYSSVKSILAQNLDRAPLPAPASPAPPPPEHENLRGPGYYAEEKEA